jgi:hypothetical protein
MDGVENQRNNTSTGMDTEAGTDCEDDTEVGVGTGNEGVVRESTSDPSLSVRSSGQPEAAGSSRNRYAFYYFILLDNFVTSFRTKPIKYMRRRSGSSSTRPQINKDKDKDKDKEKENKEEDNEVRNKGQENVAVENTEPVEDRIDKEAYARAKLEKQKEDDKYRCPYPRNLFTVCN